MGRLQRGVFSSELKNVRTQIPIGKFVRICNNYKEGLYRFKASLRYQCDEELDKEVCICRKFFVQLRKGAYKALDR